MKVTARLFRHVSPSNPVARLLQPHAIPANGELVAAIWPLKKVDPRGVYAFVITPDGSLSCLKNCLVPVGKPFDLEFERPKYSTHAQETALGIQAVRQHLSDHLQNATK